MGSGLIEAKAAQFDICGLFLHAKQFGSGHINDTYLAVFDEGGSDACYVIQRINHNVFKDPMSLMDNMVRVTEHIRSKLKQQGVSDIHRKVIEVIPAANAKTCVLDDAGNTSELSNIVNQNTLPIAPAAPLLNSPADGLTGVTTNPTLSWNPSSGATSYRL